MEEGVFTIITEKQKIHISVAFMSDNYMPNASFIGDQLRWKSLVGKGHVIGATCWRALLEMDIFDD
jgi:hypothetical protein